MLYLIGVGIDEINSLGLGTLDIIMNCDIVYVERFTGFLSDNFIYKLEQILQQRTKSGSSFSKIRLIKRWFIEDGKELLEASQAGNICILIYGDPLMATTYNELLVRAKNQSIEYKVIHASSGILSLIGESGLHPYKFGKMVTMMSDPMSSITVYDTIYNNICLGLHSLILTEYNNDDDAIVSVNKYKLPFFLKPNDVIQSLIEREQEIKLINFNDQTFLLVLSRIGTINSNIIGGNVKSLKNIDYGGGPHSIIIPGSLHFTEIDCIKNLTNCYDEPVDNSKSVDKLSHRMLNKYIPNAKSALNNLYNMLKGGQHSFQGFSIVLENAENYLWDAENFYKQGKIELAILSIGYAEGLIDSIRFQKGMNPW